MKIKDDQEDNSMKKGLMSALSALAGAAIGAGTVGKAAGKAANKKQMMSDKHLALFLMMNQWVQVKQEGKNLADYLGKNGYKSIAIYGMSYAGERLLDELKGSDVTVKYGIDKKADGIYSEIDVVSPCDVSDDVDAVVVTSIYFMDEIEEILSAKMSCPILSLEDILYEV